LWQSPAALLNLRRIPRRTGWLIAGLASGVLLTGCNHPDPVASLTADKPHDAKATTACQHWAHPREQKYLIAARDSNVAAVRAHLQKVMADTNIGQTELDTLTRHTDQDYVALCLLKYPASLLARIGAPPGLCQMTLGIVSGGDSSEGETLWADTGPKTC
jgi:hypothetical protein